MSTRWDTVRQGQDIEENLFQTNVFHCISGVMATYHAKNEYALLSDYKQGFKILFKIIELLDSEP